MEIKNFRKAALIHDNTIIGIMRYSEMTSAIVTEVTGWIFEGVVDLEGRTWDKPSDEIFFADVWVKWDSCSHFNFYGEDYKTKEDDNNSYYHICGVDGYKKFVILLWLTHQAYMLLSKCDSMLDECEIEDMAKESLFKNCCVREMGYTGDDIEIYKKYKERGNKNV